MNQEIIKKKEIIKNIKIKFLKIALLILCVMYIPIGLLWGLLCNYSSMTVCVRGFITLEYVIMGGFFIYIILLFPSILTYYFFIFIFFGFNDVVYSFRTYLDHNEQLKKLIEIEEKNNVLVEDSNQDLVTQ